MSPINNSFFREIGDWICQLWFKGHHIGGITDCGRRGIKIGWGCKTPNCPWGIEYRYSESGEWFNCHDEKVNIHTQRWDICEICNESTKQKVWKESELHETYYKSILNGYYDDLSVVEKLEIGLKKFGGGKNMIISNNFSWEVPNFKGGSRDNNYYSEDQEISLYIFLSKRVGGWKIEKIFQNEKSATSFSEKEKKNTFDNHIRGIQGYEKDPTSHKKRIPLEKYKTWYCERNLIHSFTFKREFVKIPPILSISKKESEHRFFQNTTHDLFLVWTKGAFQDWKLIKIYSLLKHALLYIIYLQKKQKIAHLQIITVTLPLKCQEIQ